MKQLSDEWWATVVHEFRQHVREETAFLDAYEALATDIRDRSVQLLLELILSDEHRHHEMFKSLADASVSDGGADSLKAPRLDAEQGARLRDPTERFLAAEREESKKLAALRRELRPLRHQTLWPLLVELMEMDTAKHIRILEFLQEQLPDVTTE